MAEHEAKQTAPAERPDKRRTPPSGDRPTNFLLMDPDFIPPFDKVTAVSTVAFTADGKIVATEEKRGPDLPGGHVQEGEETAEATARREALEEAGIKFGALHFLRAIQSDRYGTAPEDLTYMVIMTGIATELGSVPEGMTRHILTPEQFYLVHRGLAPRKWWPPSSWKGSEIALRVI